MGYARPSLVLNLPLRSVVVQSNAVTALARGCTAAAVHLPYPRNPQRAFICCAQPTRLID